MPEISTRPFIHYLLAAIIIPVYGIQVCPFIDSLTVAQVAVPVAVAVAIQFGLRLLAIKTLIQPAHLEVQTARMFKLEMVLFTLTAVGLGVFNWTAYDFPLESGLKVLVGVFGLGFFAAVDLALKQERIVALRIAETGADLNPDADAYPLTRRVALFAAASVLLLITIFILLVIKDLDWIVEVGDTIPLMEARISIIKEFIFVLAVVLPHTLNIIASYSKNLKGFLANENRVLESVTSGELGVRVPISTRDEFGIMAKRTNHMVAQLQDRITEINLTRDVTILSLASLAEARDNETGQHILRTQRYVKVLGEHLQSHPDFAEYLSDETVELLFKSAPLHDIGKVGIPDNILLKPGKHTIEEFELMKTHAQIGSDALLVAEEKMGSSSFLKLAREIALTHHEKWDGSGYPNGLKGEAIPLSGRLMAVADVYDALISKRVYKPAFPHEKAMEIIREGAATHFDPEVVKALDAVESAFRDIARSFTDAEVEVA